MQGSEGMKVKICGITNADDAGMCESLGADALGFVHYEGRRRSLPIYLIRDIVSTVGPMTTKVLVCAPRSAIEAISIGEKAGVDTLQLYSLVPNDIASIRSHGFKVIRALEHGSPEAQGFSDVVDAILFESGKPGSGQSYDYSQIPVGKFKRVIIAGGLTIDNLHLAKALRPYALDVSSGVERSFGKKDPELVAEFIRRCRE
jgi:phosphoribosylanthranilate isomerase